MLQIFLEAAKVYLKGLKHATSNGCNSYELWLGNVMKSTPCSFVLSMTSKVTWLLWPSNITKCLLVGLRDFLSSKIVINYPIH